MIRKKFSLSVVTKKNWEWVDWQRNWNFLPWKWKKGGKEIQKKQKVRLGIIGVDATVNFDRTVRPMRSPTPKYKAMRRQSPSRRGRASAFVPWAATRRRYTGVVASRILESALSSPTPEPSHSPPPPPLRVVNPGSTQSSPYESF